MISSRASIKLDAPPDAWLDPADALCVGRACTGYPRRCPHTSSPGRPQPKIHRLRNLPPRRNITKAATHAGQVLRRGILCRRMADGASRRAFLGRAKASADNFTRGLTTRTPNLAAWKRGRSYIIDGSSVTAVKRLCARMHVKPDPRSRLAFGPQPLSGAVILQISRRQQTLAARRLTHSDSNPRAPTHHSRAIRAIIALPHLPGRTASSSAPTDSPRCEPFFLVGLLGSCTSASIVAEPHGAPPPPCLRSLLP